MSETTLSAALQAEHREIDAGIEEYARSAQEGQPQVEPVLRAMGALRRHIYLEEAMLFPSLREAGLVAPVFVMVREHGEIWRSMDALEGAVGRDASGSAAADICREMVFRTACSSVTVISNSRSIAVPPIPTCSLRNRIGLLWVERAAK